MFAQWIPLDTLGQDKKCAEHDQALAFTNPEVWAILLLHLWRHWLRLERSPTSKDMQVGVAELCYFLFMFIEKIQNLHKFAHSGVVCVVMITCVHDKCDNATRVCVSRQSKKIFAKGPKAEERRPEIVVAWCDSSKSKRMLRKCGILQCCTWGVALRIIAPKSKCSSGSAKEGLNCCWKKFLKQLLAWRRRLACRALANSTATHGMGLIIHVSVVLDENS